MGSLGWPELLFLAAFVMLLFGARKLPEIGRGLGEGIRSFRTALRQEEPDRKEDSSNNTTGGGSK